MPAATEAILQPCVAEIACDMQAQRFWTHPQYRDDTRDSEQAMVLHAVAMNMIVVEAMQS